MNTTNDAPATPASDKTRYLVTVIRECNECHGKGEIDDPSGFWTVYAERDRLMRQQLRAQYGETRVPTREEDNALLKRTLQDLGHLDADVAKHKNMPPDVVPCLECDRIGTVKEQVSLLDALAAIGFIGDTEDLVNDVGNVMATQSSITRDLQGIRNWLMKVEQRLGLLEKSENRLSSTLDEVLQSQASLEDDGRATLRRFSSAEERIASLERAEERLASLEKSVYRLFNPIP